MGIYFGTDGIRGEYGKEINASLAERVGNSLAQIKSHPKILLGHDTRTSADVLSLAVALGAIKGGASVTNVGIIPTAGVSFLTEKERFDFGVMITASHNPPNCNGIKIFSPSGQKLSPSDENFLEEYMQSDYTSEMCGKYKHCENFAYKYIKHLLSCTNFSLDGLKVCLDASNGASFKIAPMVFKKLGAHVIKCACKPNGKKINVNCGSLHIENLVEKVLNSQSDIGFAFDGDADRVIAVSHSGEIFDGDKLLYILANYMQENGELYASSVVGTSHTNSGLMIGLNQNKINLIRTDVGDKYVIEAMEKMNLSLGGEQSGHIIIKKYAQTGDGILSAIKICEILKRKNTTLETLFDAKLIPQTNLNINVADKIKVLNNETLKNLIQQISNELSPSGRVLVRASGTENKIRVMVEHPDLDIAANYAKELKSVIEKI